MAMLTDSCCEHVMSSIQVVFLVTMGIFAAVIALALSLYAEDSTVERPTEDDEVPRG